MYSPAIIGLGSVGSGWASLMLAKGISIRAFDPGENAEQKTKKLILQSWPAIIQMGLSELKEPPFSLLKFYGNIAETVVEANVILENVPEKLTLKQSIIAAIEEAATREALVLSSSGGLPATSLQEACLHPERVVVMHPFNPSYLIPLVEIVPGKRSSKKAIEQALDFAKYLNKYPIVIQKEQSGHMVNRLQFALMREAIRCLVEGVASASDIDAAVRYGLAPRWLLMGGLHTLALAGGPGGMAGILDMAGPAMEKWWEPLGEVKVSSAVKEELLNAEKELGQETSFENWVAWRNQQLIRVLNLQSEADEVKPFLEKT